MRHFNEIFLNRTARHIKKEIKVASAPLLQTHHAPASPWACPRVVQETLTYMGRIDELHCLRVAGCVGSVCIVTSVAAAIFMSSPTNDFQEAESKNFNQPFKTPLSCWRLWPLKCRRNVTVEPGRMQAAATHFHSRDKVFYEHAVNNTVMVIQANAGFVDMVFNCMTSLRIAGGQDMVKRLVVWSMTNATTSLFLRRQSEWGFGIYEQSMADNALMKLPVSDRFESGGTTSYYDMMRVRIGFYLHLVRDLGMGLFFVDADVVFLQDPWPWVVSNQGLGWKNHEEAEDAYDLIPPDIVFGPDANGMYYDMLNPYQSFQASVPKICGGFFYARPTVNSVRIYTDLNRMMWTNEESNDQWTMDQLLEDGRDVLLVGTPPNGLCRRRMPCHVHSTCLRIRILDQMAFMTAR